MAPDLSAQPRFYQIFRYRLLANLLWGVLIMLLTGIMILVGGLSLNLFGSSANSQNLLWSWLTIALLAPPLALIVASGGVDLSVGSVIGLIATIIAVLSTSQKMSIEVAFLVGLGVALLVGLLNAVLIGLARLNAVVVTLAMMALLRGVVYLMTEMKTVTVREVGLLSSLLLPGLALALMALVCIALSELTLWLNRSRSQEGRAAWLRQSLLTGFPYILSALMAGVAGACYLGRLRAAIPTLGAGLELDALLVVVLGGTPFGGGLVNVVGGVLAALLLALGQNIALLNGMPAAAINLGKGAALLVVGLLCHAYGFGAGLLYRKVQKKAEV